MIKVRVELIETSQALEYEAKNTYTKGGLFCVYTAQDEVHKIPLANIWRIVEDYGPHSRRTA